VISLLRFLDMELALTSPESSNMKILAYLIQVLLASRSMMFFHSRQTGYEDRELDLVSPNIWCAVSRNSDTTHPDDPLTKGRFGCLQARTGTDTDLVEDDLLDLDGRDETRRERPQGGPVDPREQSDDPRRT
jgi:hypothetical protein